MKKFHFVLKILLPILMIASLAYIYSNSSENSKQSSEKTSKVADTVVDIVETVTQKPISVKSKEHVVKIVPKWGHHIEFMAFAFFLSASVFIYGKDLADSGYRIAFIGLSCAVIDEYIQTFSSGRSSKVTDIFVDFSGVLVGFGVMLAVSYFHKKHLLKKENTE